MKQRPILFKSEMVQAILAGRKTQTRRALKIQPRWVESDNPIVSSGWQYEGKKGLPKLISWPTEEDFATALLECEKCPYGQVGDQLWVREAFGEVYDYCEHPEMDSCPDERWHIEWKYRADSEQPVIEHGCFTGWKPSIHMPRWVSRILLEITDIRVERLQDISEADAKAEGCCYGKGGGVPDLAVSPEDHFPTLWESINGADSWAANPWVWLVEFKVIEGGDL